MASGFLEIGKTPLPSLAGQTILGGGGETTPYLGLKFIPYNSPLACNIH